MRLLDTSMVVRYLLRTPPELAQVSRRIIDEESALAITDVAVTETAHVLTSVYRLPREAVVNAWWTSWDEQTSTPSAWRSIW